jgi:hypothetical protein
MAWPGAVGQLAGSPTIWPQRAKEYDKKGSVGMNRSIIDRTMRGGSRSKNTAQPMQRPSIGSWPEWFAIRSTRPSGMFSMPWTSQRK